jgi:hypothetical protein
VIEPPLLKTFTINLELRKPVAGQYLVLVFCLQSATGGGG